MDHVNVQKHPWHHHCRWWGYPLHTMRWTIETLGVLGIVCRHSLQNALQVPLVEIHHNTVKIFAFRWPWFDIANRNAQECLLQVSWSVNRTFPELASDPIAQVHSCAISPKSADVSMLFYWILEGHVPQAKSSPIAMHSLKVHRDLHLDLAACALLPTPLGLEVEFPLHQHCEDNNNNNNNSLSNSLMSPLLKILMAERKGAFDRLHVEVRCCWLCCSEGQLQT